MTREEAIKRLEDTFEAWESWVPHNDSPANKLSEALGMAIADRIRAMSDEELMGFLFNEVSCGSICEFCVPVPRKSTKCDGHCRNGILKWLQQPVKEDA